MKASMKSEEIEENINYGGEENMVCGYLSSAVSKANESVAISENGENNGEQAMAKYENTMKLVANGYVKKYIENGPRMQWPG